MHNTDANKLQLRDRPELHLARALGARARSEGGFASLAAAISARFRERCQEPLPEALHVRDVVDRRKLKRLVEQDRSVVLSILELEALDIYLDRFDEGLSRKPFFARPSILQVLAESMDATFVLGSRAHEDGVDLSNWDVMAMAEVQREVNRYSTRMRFDIRDVVLQGPGSRDDADRDEGLRALTTADGPSLVCIGSPRACRPAELLLANMFQVEPFRPRPLISKAPPFRFVWPHQDALGARSSFHLHPQQIRAEHPDVHEAIGAGDGWGLVVNGRGYLSQSVRGRTQVRAIGVIAAQRLRRGQMRIVLAGLTGAGTYACAAALPSIQEVLGGSRPEGRPRTLWTVVEAMVEVGQVRISSQPPRVFAQKLVVPPTFWPAAV